MGMHERKPPAELPVVQELRNPNKKKMSPKLPIKSEMITSLPEEVEGKRDGDNIGGIDAKTAIAMQGRWAIWFDYSKPGMTDREYTESLRMLSGFKTHDEFSKWWATIDLERLKQTANLRVFRAGILPYWTAKRNVHGGQFSVRLHDVPESNSDVFERIMEMLINSELLDCAKLNGVCFGKKGEKQTIKIWTSTVQLNVQGCIDQLQDVCEELGARQPRVSFISFKELNADKILQNKEDEPTAAGAQESPTPRGKQARQKARAGNGQGEGPAGPTGPGLAIFLGLAFLLGLCSTDIIFDAAALPICRAYHCALLDSLGRFPQMLRLLIPVLLLAAGLTMRLQSSVEAAELKMYDIITAVTMGVGGVVAFVQTTGLSSEMCGKDLTKNNIEAVAAMRDSLMTWDIFMGGVVCTATLVQVARLNACGASKAKKD